MTIARLVLLLAAVSTAAGLAPFGADAAAAGRAPTVTEVAVMSEAGDDATYALGETIEVTVTFSEAVTVDTAGGTPGLSH